MGMHPLLLMDLYHDERSLKVLLKMLHTQPQALPSGFLFGYDLNEEFRTLIRGELAKEALGEVFTERRTALSGLLSSWEYADSLEPNAKRRYLDFERRFYAAESISPADGSRNLLNYINYGAYIFSWKEGDNAFLAHKLECTESFFFDHALARKLAAYYPPEEPVKVKEAEEKKK